MALVHVVAARWKRTHPAVAQRLEDGMEDCLACLAFPVAHRPRIRSTKGLERLNEEIKRRTRVVRIVPNAAACLRLLTDRAVCRAVGGVVQRATLPRLAWPVLDRGGR